VVLRTMSIAEAVTDILIVGGGLGGVAGALAALRMGRRVILTEPTDWLGGQLTSQAVPPDENPWIEGTGCTRSYRQLRDGIRNYYRRNYPLTMEARMRPFLNPGAGAVSLLCHEPQIAVAVIEELLAPYQASRQLLVLLQHRLLSAETDGDKITAVTLQNLRTGNTVAITAKYILDATEFGDLLEAAGIESITGSESQSQTGEPHALTGQPDPLDQQAASWCFALDYYPDEDHTIARPEHYHFWRDYQPDFWGSKLFSWTLPNPQTLQPQHRALFVDERSSLMPLWHYRRILSREHYPDGTFASDITLVNYPQIDYWLAPLVGVTTEQRERHLNDAMQQSLSFLYWMQTDAPRHDGAGYGYPGLRLRDDIVGTDHGLAKHIYVRESRRIRAEFTVLEQHIGIEARGEGRGAEQFEDSVGIGYYRIDLHPSTGLRHYIDIDCYPFQIPLGALLPVRAENVLPACKNIGTTHITNGCYRVHPVEWNIGEAAGALAAYAAIHQVTPRQVRTNKAHLHNFQTMLKEKLGFILQWPSYARNTVV
jgi:hypothetical protein